MARQNGNLNTGNNKKLDYSKKKLKTIPSEVLEDTDISILDLDRNRLKDTLGISTLTNLRELILSRNELLDFPLEIKQLFHLEKLYLNQNKIQNIPEGIFSQLQKLELLKLSTNRLSKLPSDISCCKNLQHLGLSHNYLKELNEAVADLPKLKELFVDNNRLSELPARLFENKNLTTFRAAANRLREPPDEVCAGGLKQIRRYFSQLSSSQADYIHRVKTMFLGSSMAGKSTLCRSLQEGKVVTVSVADRTVGIEISEVQKEDFSFLFWDFAGQEEYYLTHHVFITPQALVILVINLKSYSIGDPQSFKEEVSFWINNVLMRVPDSVVLPVGTHIDKCENSEEIKEKKADIEINIKKMLDEREARLEQRRKNIREKMEPALFSDQTCRLDQVTGYNLKVLDFIAIDGTNQADIEYLQAQILECVQNKDLFPNIEKKLPRVYQTVESSIRDLLKDHKVPDHGIVSLNALLSDINCKLTKIDKDDLKDILRYLHRIGIIMWYEDIPALIDTVFVKPSFLIALFKTIVRHDLENQLKKIPKDLLMSENALVKHRRKWVEDFHRNATLHNTAMRLLVKMSLLKENSPEDEDFMEEIAGTKQEGGKLLRLLKHFEICLATKLSNPLNPDAMEFSPDSLWKMPQSAIPNDACMFPSYLKNNDLVSQKWGEDKVDDINIHIYLLPEIPQGLFHRLIIKVCSLYAPHWVGREKCLVISNAKCLLLKENHEEDDQFIEIRCRRPQKLVSSIEFQTTWDMILAIMCKMAKLEEQWPGLCRTVCSPCTVNGCSADFDWPDKNESESFYDMVKQDMVTCDNGHTQRTEFLFPKGRKV
uniref:Si:ch211-210p4.6 n=1 Tax=Lepisosteus oculatus TaxID=7918 RepID=W5LWH4_LEPOC